MQHGTARTGRGRVGGDAEERLDQPEYWVLQSECHTAAEAWLAPSQLRCAVGMVWCLCSTAEVCLAEAAVEMERMNEERERIALSLARVDENENVNHIGEDDWTMYLECL